MLSDVKEQNVERLTIFVPLQILDNVWIASLFELAKQHPGKTKLSFQVYDAEENMSLNMNAPKIQVMVGKELTTFLDQNPDVKIQIN
jgi:DNA polymerase-3 subunit alpha